MEDVLRHFDGKRYTLGAFVVAPNHVHVLVTPLAEHLLSEALHSWKSFSAHEIGKLIKSGSGVSPLLTAEPGRLCHSGSSKVWQKESFDHIVRSPASLARFRVYIQNHADAKSGSGIPPLHPPAKQRRDAAATF